METNAQITRVETPHILLRYSPRCEDNELTYLKSRFTRHYKASLSEAKHGIVLQDY